MLFRNDEHMAGAERMNVHERDAEFVFMHKNGGFGPGGDLAEQAGGIIAQFILPCSLGREVRPILLFDQFDEPPCHAWMPSNDGAEGGPDRRRGCHGQRSPERYPPCADSDACAARARSQRTQYRQQHERAAGHERDQQ
jgi:hypothetical protein